MAIDNRKLNVRLELVKDCYDSGRVNYQKLVDPPVAAERPHGSRNFAKNSQQTLICTQPIQMKITCIRKPQDDGGPVGRITRNQDCDLIGSKFVYRCTCASRNGLDPECKRVACQSNPGCKMTPPRCWPQYRPQPQETREIEGPIRLCYVIGDCNAQNNYCQ